MTLSAHDVAHELRRRLGDIGTTKLHKLLYYAQGWHIARTGQPMFRETVNAWVNGPVVAELWADEKHGRGRPAVEALDASSLATVDYVVHRYGDLSAADLIKLTHEEDPWRELSESEDPAAGNSPEITHDALARWFRDDDHYVAYEREVKRLRQRVDVHAFAPIERTLDVDAAVARAVGGTRVRHRRHG
jgi:uncharacterized phage-associated protein